MTISELEDLMKELRKDGFPPDTPVLVAYYWKTCMRVFRPGVKAYDSWYVELFPEEYVAGERYRPEDHPNFAACKLGEPSKLPWKALTKAREGGGET